MDGWAERITERAWAEALKAAVADAIRIAGDRARLALAEYKHGRDRTPYLNGRRPDYERVAAAIRAELGEWERILLETDEPVEDVRDLEARLRDLASGLLAPDGQ